MSGSQTLGGTNSGPIAKAVRKPSKRDDVHALIGRCVRYKEGVQLTDLFIREYCLWNHIHRSGPNARAAHRRASNSGDMNYVFPGHKGCKVTSPPS
jgi:hypothetical protein